MRKRQKLVLTAFLLAIFWGAAQAAPLEWRYWLVGLLGIVGWGLSYWALREGLDGAEWLMVLLPIGLFMVAVGLFYILLPVAWAARILIGILLAIGLYALLLTANIFSVAAIRTIALFRAALAVSFVMTLLTGFLLFDTILSFRLSFWIIGILVSSVAFLMFVPSLWSVKLEKRVSADIWTFSIVLSVLMGWLAVAVSFWPINLSVAALFLSTMLYIFLGVSQHHFQERLFVRTVWEYITVGGVVLMTMLLTSGWGV